MKHKIAIFSAFAHKLYGLRRDLFDTLRSEGFKIYVFGPEDEALSYEELRPAGIPYKQIHIGRHSVNPLAETAAVFELASEIKKERIEFIMSYGVRNAPLVDNAARLCKIPAVNVVNGAGTLFMSEGAAAEALRAAVVPYMRATMGYAKTLVFQNDDDLELFRSLGIARDGKIKRVNGSGVNTGFYEKSPLPDENVFGFVGRLCPEKGIAELITAFRRLREKYPSAMLRIAGARDGLGGLEPEFDRAVSEGLIDYVGEISDVKGFLKTLRFFVFPSYREGTPRSVLEAMSSGRPVITTDTVGCRETVTDGYNGLLVPVKDADALYNAMLHFCENGSEAEKMGENARTLAESKFDMKLVNREMIKTVYGAMN